VESLRPPMSRPKRRKLSPFRVSTGQKSQPTASSLGPKAVYSPAPHRIILLGPFAKSLPCPHGCLTKLAFSSKRRLSEDICCWLEAPNSRQSMRDRGVFEHATSTQQPFSGIPQREVTHCTSKPQFTSENLVSASSSPPLAKDPLAYAFQHAPSPSTEAVAHRIGRI
jgi:hypothetical protein